MATPPFGTLVFSGFGDDPFEFRDIDGNVVAPPASNPDGGSGVTGIVGLSTGKVCVVGGNIPNFGTTGVGIFAIDWLSSVEAAASPFPGIGIARDDNDNFYGIRNATSVLYQYDALGNQTDNWTLTGANVFAFAVNGAGTICYYVLAAARDTVLGWDLNTNLSLGTITTEVGFRVLSNSVYSDTNGDLFVGWDRTAAGTGYVKRYNSTGTLQQTYTLTGSGQAPICVTNGLTEETFWVCFYNNDSITSSGVTVVELNIVSGLAVQAPFDPEDGAFQFDASFCVIGFAEPPPDVTYLWTKVSGPGTVTFDDDTILNAEVTISSAGVYVLRLTATSGCQALSDDVTITVLDSCVMPSADPVFDCE